jgi:hypothetical protein
MSHAKALVPPDRQETARMSVSANWLDHVGRYSLGIGLRRCQSPLCWTSESAMKTARFDDMGRGWMSRQAVVGGSVVTRYDVRRPPAAPKRGVRSPIVLVRQWRQCIGSVSCAAHAGNQES